MKFERAIVGVRSVDLLEALRAAGAKVAERSHGGREPQRSIMLGDGPGE